MKSIAMTASAALLIAVAMIGAVSAQSEQTQQGGTYPGGMMGNDGGPGMMHWGSSGSAMCGAMAGHIDGRLAYIKAELKITDAQESLWNNYAAAARDSANTMVARCTTMMARHSGSTASLPDRLDQNEQLMAAQLDALRATNKALKPLYAALSDSQKQAADQLFWGPMGMM